MRFIYLFITICFLSLSQTIHAQQLEIQGVGGIDCTDNLFHLTLQVRSDSPTNINIGSFSIFFTFDESIMTFNNFQSLNFDGSDLCDAGSTAWSEPKHGTISGFFNMNYILNEGSEASSCPTLDNNWVDVADVVFDVSDFPADGDLAFVLENTHFNTNIPNNGNSTIPIISDLITINNCLGDIDGDGISDDTDNCPFVANPLQEDLNMNGVGDVCEVSCDLQAYTGSDLLICAGDIVTLAANGIGGTPPYGFEWSNGDLTNFTTVTVNTTTPYYLTVTDSDGCIDLDTVNVVISDMEVLPGLIVVQAAPIWTYVDTIYDGDVVNFMDLPTNYRLRTFTNGFMESMQLAIAGDLEYTRHDNSSRYDFFQSGTGGNIFLSPGTYNLNLMPFTQDDLMGANCTSRDISFTIVSDCLMELGPDTAICANELLVLDATSQGVEPINYLWSTGETTPTVSVSPTTDSLFSITVTDATGCQINDFIQVDVHDSGTVDAIAIINPLTGLPYDIIEGGEVYVLDDLPLNFNIDILTTNVDGSLVMDLDGPTDIFRYSNSLPHLLNESGDNFELPIGDYTLTASAYTSNSGAGETCSSLSVSFTVISCPRVEMEDDFIFCTTISNNNVEIIRPIITGNSGPYTYNWSDGTIADTFILNQPLADTTFYLSVTNGLSECPATEDSIEVYVSDIDITDVTIIDKDNLNSVYQSMRDGDIYNIQDLPSNYNFEAFTTGTVGSIRFHLKGDLDDPDNENVAPYRFNGDNTITNLPPGNYSMTTNIYTQANAVGPSCEEIITHFTVVDCAGDVIAGTLYDECESHTAVVANNNVWQDVVDELGQVIASFKDPGNANLGTVTVDVSRSQMVSALSFPGAGAVKLLPRNFHFSASNYPTSGNFTEPVSVRLYFTNEELANMNASDAGDYGLSNYEGQELSITHYFGDNQDCDYDNNIITGTNYEQPNFTHQSHSCNGHYLEFEVNHFSEFIINAPFTILPVELISFTGTLVDERVKLQWETALEDNVSHFELEKSADTENWETIGNTPANNNASKYLHWDNQPLNGMNYYRLKIVDLDGSFEFSDIVNILLETDGKNILGDINPNPVKSSTFNVSIYLENESDVSFQISNSLGQIISSSQQQVAKGNSNLFFSVHDFSNGLFWIHITVGNEHHVRSFEVLR